MSLTGVGAVEPGTPGRPGPTTRALMEKVNASGADAVPALRRAPGAEKPRADHQGTRYSVLGPNEPGREAVAPTASAQQSDDRSGGPRPRGGCFVKTFPGEGAGSLAVRVSAFVKEIRAQTATRRIEQYGPGPMLRGPCPRSLN